MELDQPVAGQFVEQYVTLCNYLNKLMCKNLSGNEIIFTWYNFGWRNRCEPGHAYLLSSFCVLIVIEVNVLDKLAQEGSLQGETIPSLPEKLWIFPKAAGFFGLARNYVDDRGGQA